VWGVNDKIDISVKECHTVGHFPRCEDANGHNGAAESRFHQSLAVRWIGKWCLAAGADAIDSFGREECGVEAEGVKYLLVSIQA